MCRQRESASGRTSRTERGYVQRFPSASVPYDENLARRVRRLLPKAAEKRMFGGIGLMERGHLVAGVSHSDLVVRVPPEETGQWLRQPGVGPMMAGRSMMGWVKVSVKALADEATLAEWVRRSRSVTRAMPPK
jgi:TfoX/Sxy family transcriptional regulator of competence genes